jgi:hypothetical protein
MAPDFDVAFGGCPSRTTLVLVQTNILRTKPRTDSDASTVNRTHQKNFPQYHIVTLVVENDVYNTFDFVELTEVALDHATK